MCAVSLMARTFINRRQAIENHPMHIDLLLDKYPFLGNLEEVSLPSYIQLTV